MSGFSPLLRNLLILVFLLAAGLAAIAVSGIWVSRVEQPTYQALASEGPLELRDYPALIVAETRTTGTRREALEKGFRLLADFIFGANTPSAVEPATQTPAGTETAPTDLKTSAMEATSVQVSAKSVRIPMTAPVIQQADGAEGWLVRFVLPRTLTLETLPRPLSAQVRLMALPPARYVAFRFTGFVDEQKVKDATAAAEAYAKSLGKTPRGEPLVAFYNPPWTLPFMRRNEVLIEVD